MSESNPGSNFLINNWDKVLSIIIAGVVGFFSSIFITNKEISQLKEKIIETNTIYKTTVEPKLSILDSNLEEMRIIKQRIEVLQLKTSTEDLIRENLEESLEKLRLETLKELSELLSKEKE